MPASSTDAGQPPARRRVALLQCDHVDAPLRGVAGDYLDMFLARFDAHAPELAVDPVDVVGGAALPDPDAYDAIVISGSRHSVTDDLPWIRDLEDHVRAASEARVPTVGICFGHQLIATALGGRVERAAAGWGVGVHEAAVTRPRAWMDPPQDRFRLLVSHQDQVVDLPPGATVVADSAHAPVAAFEVGTCLGLQGHPEFVPAYAAALMQARSDRIPAEVIAAARTTLEQPTDHGIVTRWMARFLAGS